MPIKRPLDPRQMQFWTQEERELWNELSPLLLKIHIAGAVAGEALLPANLRVLVNWDVINTNAIDWLYKYRLGNIGGIMSTTRDRAIKAIDDWIRSGEPLPNLEARLRRWFDDKRASRIAVTEVTNIYSQGNLTSWKSTNMIGGKKWNTARDELVCELCGPLDQFVVPVDSGFSVVDGKPVEDPEGVDGPAIHVGDRCWLTPVVSLDKVRSEIERAIEEA